MATNATQVVYGTDLLLLIEDTAGKFQPVAHATSHSIELTRDSREVTSKSTGEWKLADYGKISWSASLDGLVSYDAGICNYETLAQKMISRTKVKIVSILNDITKETPLDDLDNLIAINGNTFVTGSMYWEGQAIITSLSQSAGEGENATFSLSLEGATALVQKTVVAGA